MLNTFASKNKIVIKNILKKMGLFDTTVNYYNNIINLNNYNGSSFPNILSLFSRKKEIKKFSEFEDYEEHILADSPLREFPAYICLELTNACQLRCVMCQYQGTHAEGYQGCAGMLDEKIARKVLDEADKYKCSIMLNGDGESTLHPKFLDIFRYASSKKNIPQLYFNTNANRLDEKLADQLTDFFEGAISVSLDGFKKSHEELRVGSNYDVVFNNLTNLQKLIDKKKARIKVQVNYVRYTQPEGEYEKFVKFWVERVDSVNSCVTWDHEYKLSHGRIKKYDPEKRQICNIPWQTFIVRWNGKVIPCTNCFTKAYEGFWIIGDVNKNSLKEIWNGDKYNKWREEVKNSKFNNICEPCDRWKMQQQYKDEYRDGMKIRHGGCFEVHEKLPLKDI